MITFLVVGRNDGYGVNLHKRTALSLNYFASQCEDEDDEIVYVDCNSAEGEVTLAEAIADTLTPQARERLRIYRITGEQMRLALGESPLPFSDELSRNVGIRRSNPKNSWLLSTNCDVLVHRVGTFRWRELLGSLERRYHVCPRIGVPPGQWQMLDRQDVAQVSEFADEIIARGARFPAEKGEPWLRFNAVGDFQLAPREQWFEIRGCEEAMKLWGHSDANNALRLSLLNGGGRTPDLSSRLRVIHLDHDLEYSSSDRKPLPKNDWKQWIENVTDAKSTNGEAWGLRDVDLKAIDLKGAWRGSGRDIVAACPRRRSFLRNLRLKLANRFWKSASAAANWVEEKSGKD